MIFQMCVKIWVGFYNDNIRYVPDRSHTSTKFQTPAPKTCGAIKFPETKRLAEFLNKGNNVVFP